MVERESMQFDVVIVGAGPAGLCAAIHLAQLSNQQQKETRICVVEKGSEVGAHILSGAILDPRALNELLPDWQNQGAPLNTPASEDHFCLLTQNKAFPLPLPPQMNNEGNYLISLGNLCRWLAQQAEELGIEIFPGFAASEVLYDKQGAVIGIATGDMGLQRDGQPGPQYEPGVELHSRQLIVAEGCRGSLSQQLEQRFDLRQQAGPQTYGLGLKELWEITPQQHIEGKVWHSIGWPLDTQTYGGSFLYHQSDHQLVVGFVVGLDYKNPYLDPFEEFQRFKTHPAIRPLFEGGKRLSYGARALSEGGFQSIPRLTFPGGVLVGDGAGLLNVPRIKGIHSAMKSGMCAAQAIFSLLENEQADEQTREATQYAELLRQSWLWAELQQVRNIRPGFQYGLWPGLINAALETYLLRGKAPWTLQHHADHEQLRQASACRRIDYPRADGVVSFDRLSSVYLSNTNHKEDQPVHLRLNNSAVPITINLARYDAPEQRYCPAGVYEIIDDENHQPRLQINAQNCLHCKTCDIKDPTQNITWVVPEGGDGPNYPNM